MSRALRDLKKPIEESSKQTETMRAAVKMPAFDPADVAFGAAAGFPIGATPITVTATGTISATAVTLPGVPGRTTYLCGFSIRIWRINAGCGPPVLLAERAWLAPGS